VQTAVILGVIGESEVDGFDFILGLEVVVYVRGRMVSRGIVNDHYVVILIILHDD
jgi:hypothetical protein